MRLLPINITFSGDELPDADLDLVAPPRRELVATVRRLSRQSDFRYRVLTAYRHMCSICEIQLDLVEAAHILPVGAPGSIDATSNGLSLCILHHRAYDDVLIGISEDYRVLRNDLRLRELERFNLTNKQREFFEGLRPVLLLPRRASDRPRPDYLRSSMQFRGWPRYREATVFR